MNKNIKEYDCQRGCEIEFHNNQEVTYTYNRQCCKRSVFNWLDGISQEDVKDLYEVRFKNTRKIVCRAEANCSYKIGEIVVVEAQNGCDVGIITLAGPILVKQLKRDRITDYEAHEFKKIYRKARPADIDKWQIAIAREHNTMIRSRQMAADLKLNMKIGDVEFQGDNTKAIFYYIADERVDFRQLIKNFAEEFRIRIEMKQIGARQEAGLIGGLGVCGQALCCSRYMNNFQSITTQAARSQDLSLNPQKLAGQCGKLKCCINYEASTYIDAQSRIPRIYEPLQLEDGEAYLMKTDILRGLMWFSYDQHSMANMKQITAKEARKIIFLNKKGTKAPSLFEEQNNKSPEFMSAVGEDSISRFDNSKKKRSNSSRPKREWRERGGEKNNDNTPREESREQGENRGNRDRAPREDRQSRENRTPRENRQPRENRAPRENRQPRENRAHRENRQPRENRVPKEERTPKENNATPTKEA